MRRRTREPIGRTAPYDSRDRTARIGECAAIQNTDTETGLKYSRSGCDLRDDRRRRQDQAHGDFFQEDHRGKARSRVRERNGLQLALSLSYFRNPVCVRAEVRVRARVILSGPAARVFHSHIIVILADFTIMCICMRI